MLSDYGNVVATRPFERLVNKRSPPGAARQTSRINRRHRLARILADGGGNSCRAHQLAGGRMLFRCIRYIEEEEVEIPGD